MITAMQLERLASYGPRGEADLRALLPAVLLALPPAGSPSRWIRCGTTDTPGMVAVGPGPDGYGSTCERAWPPAGDIATGVPAENYPAGVYRFRSAILVRSAARPIVHVAPVQFAGVVVPGFRTEFEHELDREFNGPPDRYHARPSDVSASVGEAGVVNGVPTWWITITGTVTIAWASWRPDRLNAALSRALAISTTWGEDARLPGGMARTATNLTLVANALLGVFRDPAACAGAPMHEGTLPWSRACTRFENTGPLPHGWTEAALPRPPAPQPPPGPVAQPSREEASGPSLPMVAVALAGGTVLAGLAAYFLSKNA